MTILASLLALALLAVAGFSTTAGAAALTRPYAPVGATGTGADAPPPNSQPFNAKVWDAKNYRIVHHAASCPQPPQSVATRMALVNSPTLLRYYGLPALAIFHGDLARWQRAVTRMRTQQCDDTLYIKNGHPLYNFGNSDQKTWAGWGNNKCTGCWGYQAADLEFYVPSIQATASADDSIWVGVGGANGDALSQVGVEEDSTSWINLYSVFYENIGSGECASDTNPHSPWNVNPGDWMYVYTDRTGYDIMSDGTTGNYKALYWGCSSTDSAEFIVERNGCTSGPLCASLAKFGSVTAHHAEYEDSSNTWYTVPNNSGGYGDGFYRWQMINSSSQLLVGDGSVSNDSYGGSTYGSTWVWTWYRGS